MSSSDPDMDPMGTPGDVSGSRSYELSGKIMLSAIVILFFVVILMVCLHVYARWYLLRARRRYLRRRNRNRRHTTVFFVDPSSADAGARGLDPSVLKSLPVFNFSSATHPNSIECAVCLSEFEENESCRFLPNCKHSFHVECIDMWFHSHSTCPLCRSLIEPVCGEEIPADVVIRIPGEPVHRNEPGSNTNSDGAETSEPPDENWIKPVAIEVPRRTFGEFEDESTRGGSSASSSLRSPMSRMLSFKRILSRDRRTVPSPSGGAPSSCLSVNEPDIERAIEENR